MRYEFDGPNGRLVISYARDLWYLSIYGIRVNAYESAEDAAADLAAHGGGVALQDADAGNLSPATLEEWHELF